MRHALTVICWFVVASSAWLVTMSIALGRGLLVPPVFFAVGFVAQSLLVLASLRAPGFGSAQRFLALAVATATAAAGLAVVHRTLTVGGFEGYALIIGTVVAAEGVLTLLTLGDWRAWGSSKVHEFVK